MILAVGMAVFTYISMTGSFSLIYVGVLLVALIPAYVALTVLRSHSVEYLNGIFEMKNSRMPIFITQPYMYIANNYDNFDCLVEALAAGHSHSFGLRMLFPLWALTGLKFLFPQLTAFELFTTKEELTTVTLFYDAYYDFGLIGVVLLACALGALAFYLTDMVKHIRNPIGYLCMPRLPCTLACLFHHLVQQPGHLVLSGPDRGRGSVRGVASVREPGDKNICSKKTMRGEEGYDFRKNAAIAQKQLSHQDDV